MFNERVAKAKRELYHLLIRKDEESITDLELNMMHDLGRDPDVQRAFAENTTGVRIKVEIDPDDILIL